MYQVGDYIIYGVTGTCEVKEIRNMKLPHSKEEKKYYVLEPLHDNSTIFVPVDNIKVFMRPVISKQTACKLIDSIPDIRPIVFHSSKMRELTEYYENVISTYDCHELIKLTMSAYEKKKRALNNSGKFGAIDQKYMNKAETLLFGELSCALKIPQDKVPEYIEDRIGRTN